LTNGRCISRRRSSSSSPQQLSGASRNGHRYIYRNPSPPSTAQVPDPPANFSVWDIDVNREIDSFPLTSHSQFSSMSESGRLLAYWDEHHIAKIRDVDQQREIYSAPGNSEDVTVSIALSSDDRTAVFINSNGVASIREIPSGRLVAQRTHLTQITPTGTDSLWIGSSSTVRLLNLSQGGQGIVGAGNTVYRDGHGALRLTSEGSNVMSRLKDPELTPLPPIPLPKGAQNLTYNGLWCLVNRSDALGSFVSVDGSVPSIRIPFGPKNVACGLHSDIFTVLKEAARWYGISGSTGAVIWKKEY